MPGPLAYSLSPADTVTLALAGLFVCLVAAIGYRYWQRSRITPEEIERRRRAHIVARGKMGDASLLEVHEEHLIYSYDVRGVEYTASQDVSMLKAYLPPDVTMALGAVLVKYDPKNPANSIVLAERWSGLRNSSLSN